MVVKEKGEKEKEIERNANLEIRFNDLLRKNQEFRNRWWDLFGTKEFKDWKNKLLQKIESGEVK